MVVKMQGFERIVGADAVARGHFAKACGVSTFGGRVAAILIGCFDQGMMGIKGYDAHDEIVSLNARPCPWIP